MRVAIMQPYFFPYIGYWQLMAKVDLWVFFEDCQFHKRSWMTRNRILHPDPEKGFQYINIQTEKSSLTDKISSIRVSKEHDWRIKVLSQLDIYKKLRAPYFEQTRELVNDILFSEYTSITQQAVWMTKKLMSAIGFDTEIKVSSSITYDFGKIQSPGEWALEICKALGAKTYINPYGGVEIFNEAQYLDAGIDLAFLKPNLSEYTQSRRAFIPGLSIIDMLMFNSSEDTRHMIQNDFRVVSVSDLTTNKLP